MKKIIAFVLCAAFMLMMVSCRDTTKPSSDDEAEERTEAEETEAEETECAHEYEETVYKEAGYGYNGMNVKSCTLCGNIEYVEVPALPDVLELTVTDKKEASRENDEGIEERAVYFDIEIENISDKKIESVEGILSAIVSNGIMEITCDFGEVSIEAGETIEISGYGYSFEYDPDLKSVDQKVYDADFEDISFSFSPTEIVVEERIILQI